MPFDEKKFALPAMRGDLGGTALTTSIALSAIIDALLAIQKGEDPAEYIEEIQRQATRLSKIFDEATGWTPE